MKFKDMEFLKIANLEEYKCYEKNVTWIEVKWVINCADHKATPLESRQGSDEVI